MQKRRDTGKEGSGQEGCGTGDMLDRTGRIQERRDAGLERRRTGGMHERKDEEKEG